MSIYQRLGGSRLTEALAYAGGGLIVIAAILLGGTYWDELGISGRLVVLGGFAVLLGIAGWVATGSSDPVRRLRSALWALSLVTFAGFLGIFGGSVLDWPAESVVLLVGLLASGYALPLWLRNHASLQLIGLFVGLGLTAGGLVAQLPIAADRNLALTIGGAVWLLSAAWVVAGRRELLRPPRVAVGIGAVGLLIACQLVMAVPWGHIVAIATVVALLGVAAYLGDTILMIAGTVGLISVGPLTVGRFFDQSVGIPLGLLAVGLLLLGIGLISAQRRRHDEDSQYHRHLFGHR